MAGNTSKPFTIQDALCISTFADRAPIRLSATGRFLAYTVEDRTGESVREHLCVTDIGTKTSWQVLPAAAASWGASWSPTEEAVAFVADAGDGPRLWFHEATSREARQVSPAPLAYYPYYRFYLPQWVPDGSALVCTIASRVGRSGYDTLGQRVSWRTAPSEPLPKTKHSVRCWESPPRGRLPGDAEALDSESDYYWSTLAQIRLWDGAVTSLAQDIQCNAYSVSPDGRYVAYLEAMRPLPRSTLYRLCLVTPGGNPRVIDPHVAEDYGVSLSWSPDSQGIAYYPNHEVAVIAAEGGGRRVVMPCSQGIIDDLYEAPLWSSDGTFLLATRHGSVWRIPVDDGEPLDLLPDRGSLAVRGIAAPGGGPALWSPDGESAIVEMRDRQSGKIGLARISLSGAGVLQSVLGMHRLSDVPRYHLDVCPNRGRVAFVRQSATCPPDVWVTDLELTQPQRVTALNPHVSESQFTEPRLVPWIGPDGHEHHSAYFPPVGADAPPHAVIFHVYEGGQSGFLSTFGLKDPCALNIQLFTNHGYGVCVPDLRISQERPVQSIREMLAFAVEALVAEGVADPARLGIFGHSYGGYIVNVAITGLDCFAAAVTSTGMANWTSVYGVPSASGDDSFSEFVESAQPRMGVPPWANPQRYVENSPLFAVDRVSTPVLIIHGDQDDCVAQAWELFSGLRRLAKPAALAIYRGEGHAQDDWRRPNVIDFWQRMLAWFDRYLTGPVIPARPTP